MNTGRFQYYVGNTQVLYVFCRCASHLFETHLFLMASSIDVPHPLAPWSSCSTSFQVAIRCCGCRCAWPGSPIFIFLPILFSCQRTQTQAQTLATSLAHSCLFLNPANITLIIKVVPCSRANYIIYGLWNASLVRIRNSYYSFC